MSSTFFKSFFHSFPVQLVLLHFRKYQIILVFWGALLATINGAFLKSFGADALFFTPEYLGKVNILSTFALGVAFGIFIMTWQITTFILHSKRFKFLATTSNPFFKYCVNNSVLPAAFLLYYVVRMFRVNSHREFMPIGDNAPLLLGFVLGLFALFVISFLYFFSANKTIVFNIAPIITDNTKFKNLFKNAKLQQIDTFGLKVNNYLTGRLKVKPVRNVQHYSQQFLDYIFKRHHLAGMICIGLALMFLITVALFLDQPFFRVPAACSILVFFSLCMAFIGALTYFLESWSIIFVLVLAFVVNILVEQEVIDFTNKAYGLNYLNTERRPLYNELHIEECANTTLVQDDIKNTLAIFNRWKQKQSTEKPKLFIINVSGGGLRSATFVANALQKLDSLSQGSFLKHTFLITGASGGMLAATYYRALYAQQYRDLYRSTTVVDNITKDLLNPVFSSMVARDLFAPAQRFKIGNYSYTKDRGYAFEQQLDENTGGILNLPFNYYKEAELQAQLPLMLYNATIENDGRKLIMATQPMRFMMKPKGAGAEVPADAVDFGTFFAQQKPEQLRLLTVLRMNATFPYVLPNVWLPSQPIINVMDAGLRDNLGEETALRFVEHFTQWIKDSTSGLVLVQLKDRPSNDLIQQSNRKSLGDLVFKPGTMQQQNWFNIQTYSGNNSFHFVQSQLGGAVQKIELYYEPTIKENKASLSFHLTQREKKDVLQSLNQPHNQLAMQRIKKLLTE